MNGIRPGMKDKRRPQRAALARISFEAGLHVRRAD
jgi:hypothetical protein